MNVEPLRREKIIGSSLEASVEIGLLSDEDFELVTAADFAELTITSSVKTDLVAEGEETLKISKTKYQKCGRCWRHLPEVVEQGGLCNRCETVLKEVSNEPL